MEGRLRWFGHTSKKDEIRIKGNRKRGELWKKLMKVIQGKNEGVWSKRSNMVKDKKGKNTSS